jgi:hypothetical protein
MPLVKSNKFLPNDFVQTRSFWCSRAETIMHRDQINFLFVSSKGDKLEVGGINRLDEIRRSCVYCFSLGDAGLVTDR